MVRKIIIDEDECISCGACADSCPDVFIMNDDNIAEVSDAEGASEEEIQEAIDGCPVECIHWEE